LSSLPIFFLTKSANLTTTTDFTKTLGQLQLTMCRRWTLPVQ